MISIINLNLNPRYQQSVCKCKCISWYFNWSIDIQVFKIFLGYKYWNMYLINNSDFMFVGYKRDKLVAVMLFNKPYPLIWFDLQKRYHNLEQAKYSSTKAKSTSNCTTCWRIASWSSITFVQMLIRFATWSTNPNRNSKHELVVWCNDYIILITNLDHNTERVCNNMMVDVAFSGSSLISGIVALSFHVR